VERIIDAAFWASLRREEGREPKISLAYLPPTAAGHPLQFERTLRLDPATLVRLAPAVERRGIHLGVWRDGDGSEPYVWGATRSLPPHCFVLEVVEPGLLVIKHRRADRGGKFGNVAVLEGEQVKFVDAEGMLSSECPSFVTSLLGDGGDAQSVLLQLALSMRAHRHGGSLLVVPHGTDGWRESILWPVPYAVAPPFSKLGDLMRAAEAERPSDGEWHEAFRAAIDAIGGLTAVDGATVLSDRWEVLAFGAKIGRRAAAVAIEQVVVKEPILGLAPVVIHPLELGGTRHLSAAQFVHEQRDALALVASQDGHFTVFSWAEPEGLVHAYRVEALLL